MANVIDYSKRDLQGLITLADTYAKELLPEWKSRDDTDINWVSAKLVAFIVSIGQFYIDFGVSEQDPYQCQIYENMLRNARKVGYTPKKASGATTTLTVKLKSVPITTTILPRGTEFQSTDGKKYVSINDDTYAIGQDTINIDVIYGGYASAVLGTSDGTAFQDIEIPVDRVQDLMFWIEVDENDGNGFIEWSRLSTLLMAEETDKSYRITLEPNRRYKIYFGDDKNGKIPALGSTIRYKCLTYPASLETDIYGRLPEGNITTCSNPLVDTVVSADNGLGGEYPVTGGNSEELIRVMGNNIAQWALVSERVGNSADCAFLARRVAGVSSASVVATGLNYYVYIVPVGGGVATPALKSLVTNYLSPRTPRQFTIDILSPVSVGIVAEATIIVDDSFKREVVRASVSQLISDFLDKPESVGEAVYLKDLYLQVAGVVGLKSCIITKLNRLGNNTVGDVALAFNEFPSASGVTVIATGGIV